MEANNLQFLKDASMESQEIKKRGPARNKNAGHSYERTLRDIFRSLGFVHLVTSRSESKARDGAKIDLINRDEHINGRFPYNLQAKNSTQIINYHDIFAGCTKTVTIKKGKRAGQKIVKEILPMPVVKGVINVIIHKVTEKVIQTSVKDGKPVQEEVFNPIAYYAIMPKKDFLQIVAERLELAQLTKEYKELNEKYQTLLRQTETNGSNH